MDNLTHKMLTWRLNYRVKEPSIVQAVWEILEVAVLCWLLLLIVVLVML